MKYPLLLPLLTITISLWAGCDDAKPPAPVEPSPTPAAVAQEPASTQPAQIEECLVCVGHKIKVKASTPRTDYAGRTYYFCSPDCLEAFKEEPTKYLVSATTQPHDHTH